MENPWISLIKSASKSACDAWTKFTFNVSHITSKNPLYNTKQSRTFDEIEKFMNTSIGKWLISVNDKTKEKENLINNLEKFNDEAQMLMTKQENRSLKHVKK